MVYIEALLMNDSDTKTIISRTQIFDAVMTGLKRRPRLAMVSPAITTDQLLRFYNAQMVAMKKGLERFFDVLIVTRKAVRKGLPRGAELSEKIVYLDFIPIPVLYSLTRAVGTYLIGLEKILDDFSPDIVISTEDFSLTSYRVVRYCAGQGISSIVWQGPYYYFGLFGGIPHRIYSGSIGRRLYSRTTLFVAKTKRAKRFLHFQGVPKQRVSIISPCIDMNLFRPVMNVPPEVDRYFPKNKTTLLYVGQLMKGKKLDVLLRGFGNAVSEDDVELLVITQGGPEKSRIQSMVRELGFKDRVNLLRNVPNRIMPAFYSRAFATLSSTQDTEIFGMNIVESLACGTPVVSTPHAGAQEIIVDGVNGMVVPGFGQDDIEIGLRALLNNPEQHARMCAAARGSVLHRFDIETISMKWRSCITELLESNKESLV